MAGLITDTLPSWVWVKGIWLVANHTDDLQASPGDHYDLDVEYPSIKKDRRFRLKALFDGIVDTLSEYRPLSLNFPKNCFVSASFIGAVISGGQELLHITDKVTDIGFHSLFREEPRSLNERPSEVPVLFLSSGRESRQGIAVGWIPADEKPDKVGVRNSGDDAILGEVWLSVALLPLDYPGL
jgi:hypothetical protein